MCALNRLLNGKTDNFHERIFEVYKHGGWPCGGFFMKKQLLKKE